MLKPIIRKAAALAAFLAILMCCGCDFKTTVITNADSPDTVAESFFSALKQKNYEKCDSFLAESATIKVTDNTECGFAGILVDFYLDNLTYESLGEAEISSVTAVKKIRITTPDEAAFLEWFKSNKTAIEKRYLKEHEQVSIDHQNTEDIRNIMSFSMELYREKAQMKSNELELTFVLDNNRWLINGTTELVHAIYGGDAYEKQ